MPQKNIFLYKLRRKKKKKEKDFTHNNNHKTKLNPHPRPHSQTHISIYIYVGPFATYTHWKQTVFYLRDVIQIKKGEEINGTFTLKANAKNPRDLDINIDWKFAGHYQKIEGSQQYFLR